MGVFEHPEHRWIDATAAKSSKIAYTEQVTNQTVLQRSDPISSFHVNVLTDRQTDRQMPGIT